MKKHLLLLCLFATTLSYVTAQTTIHLTFTAEVNGITLYTFQFTAATSPTYPPGTVHCNPSNPTAIVDVTNPTTGKIWMDRNLGAAQAAQMPHPMVNFTGGGALPMDINAVHQTLRHYSNGLLGTVGYNGYYWSNTVSSPHSRVLHVHVNNSNMYNNLRAHGLSVRCIKE